MNLTPDPITWPRTMAVTNAEDRPAPTAGILASALSRIRQTAHQIEDRVRCLLLSDSRSVAELRVLVVDDHPDAADSLAAVLELVGCMVYACYDGWSALRAAELFGPHVCLLDLVMPDLGGLEVAARLRASAGDRPLLLIATTALGDEHTRARASIAGFDAHMVKPIDAQALLATISRLWESGCPRTPIPDSPP